MNTYVEISDRTGEDYYYATVKLNSESIQIQRHLGLYKINEKELDRKRIHHVKVASTKDKESISFDYGKDKYTFFETSNGVVPYLRHELLGKHLSRAV